jgi:hypothetical protein
MVISNLLNHEVARKDVMDLHPSESSKLEPGTGRSWIVAAGSFCFVLLQSACTAVTAISGLRLLIGLTSLTAASLIPGFIITIHADRIRIPMLIVAVVGSLVNLYVLWRIRSLRSRPSSQWRVQPATAKQLRSEKLQFILSVLTLVLVVIESAIHHRLLGSL